MEASGLNVPQYDDEEKALKGLLDAFSSTCSLDEIASAYCKAGRNADLAAEILYDMQGSGSTSTTNASNFEVKGEESSESSCGNFSEKLGQENGNPRAPKQKSRPVSGGTVSSILGKDYIRSTSSSKGSYRMSKPSKPDSPVMPMSELPEVEAKSGSPVDNPMHWDMEDFLFKMLGDGFKVDRNVIREVIGKPFVTSNFIDVNLTELFRLCLWPLIRLLIQYADYCGPDMPKVCIIYCSCCFHFKKIL